MGHRGQPGHPEVQKVILDGIATVRATGKAAGILATAAGVNLPRAVVEGWLQRDELEDIVARCAACGRGAECERWLVGSGAAHAMPDFCPNKAEIEALG